MKISIINTNSISLKNISEVSEIQNKKMSEKYMTPKFSLTQLHASL